MAGVNPVFFLLEVLLILAWRNAGWIGLDHWVLPKVGTPWQREVTVSGASGARVRGVLMPEAIYRDGSVR
jgi:hypothetical protein